MWRAKSSICNGNMNRIFGFRFLNKMFDSIKKYFAAFSFLLLISHYYYHVIVFCGWNREINLGYKGWSIREAIFLCLLGARKCLIPFNKVPKQFWVTFNI